MCDKCGRTTTAVAVKEDEGKLFAVVGGEKSTYCLVMISTTRGYAELLCRDARQYRVEEFQCANKPDTGPYPVYVVSVGGDDDYRIISLTLDKKQAHKIASSLKGRVSTYKAVENTPLTVNTQFYKWFIPLGQCSNDENYYYTDSYHQRVLVYENKSPAPTLTRRRRYDDGLPYRLELSDPDQRRSGSIAEQLYLDIDYGKLSIDSLEYNVAYTLVHNQQDKWEIDPCLL